MTDEEKTTMQITSESKQEIAEAAQVTRADVEDVVQKHKQLQGFHVFLLQRKERGEPMPQTREELMQIYRIERPAFLAPKQHKKSYTQAQLKYSMRRHYC